MKNIAKILSVLMVMILMVAAVPMGASAASFDHYYPEPLFILGDTNLDNQITIKDATSIQKHLAKIIELNDDEYRCGDVDNNGRLTIQDVSKIQKYLANIIDDFYNHDTDFEANEYSYIMGKTLAVSIKGIGGAEVRFTVEEEGFYNFVATPEVDNVGFQFIISEVGTFGEGCFSESDGENEVVYARLTPGEYKAEFDSFYAQDLEVLFKGEVAEGEPPFDAEAAQELELYKEIDVKSSNGMLVYKVKPETVDYYNNWVIYTRGENPDVKMTCYDESYSKINIGYPFETTDDPNMYMDIYYDTNEWYYVVIEYSDTGSDFTICVETELDLIKKDSIEATADTAYEITIKSQEDIWGDPVCYISGVYKFVPHKSGYYSFDYRSELDFEVNQWIYNGSNTEESYISPLLEDDEEIEEVRYLKADTEYYIYYYLESEIVCVVEFEINESDEDKFLELHPEEFEPSTEDEEIIEIGLGESVEVNLEYPKNDYAIYSFTAEEDCEIVILSEGSFDAVVSVFDEDGFNIWMADDVYVLDSKDFVAKGTLEKGETCYFEVSTFSEDTDSYIFKVLDAKDYTPLA